MKVYISRKLITFASLVTLLGVGGFIVFASFGGKNTTQPQAPTNAQLLVTIEEQGQSAVGILRVDGECSNSVIASQAGGFLCTSKKEDTDGLSVSSMAFQSFSTDRTYVIPLTPTPLEIQPVVIPAGIRQQARVHIDDQGTLTLEHLTDEGIWVGGDYLLKN